MIVNNQIKQAFDTISSLKNKRNQKMQENKILNEDEIDLRELFKTIWDKRFFIIIFTFIITLISFIYVLLKNPTPVYEGMIAGECSRAEDIEVNVCKKKHLTNTRTSSADDALKLVTPKILSLEEALDYIDTDELLEVTPQSLRIRKKILDPTLRMRANRK